MQGATGSPRTMVRRLPTDLELVDPSTTFLMAVELVVPSMEWSESFQAAEREFLAAGEPIDRPPDQPIAAYVRGLKNFSEGSSAEDAVPSSIWWVVDADEYVGRVSVRHRLTEWMRVYGGHIGFEIRPSRRRMGYGTEALRMVLPHAWALGHERVLLTCAADNVGSRRIIEANGGVFEREVTDADRGVTMSRYWLDTADTD